MKMSSRQADNPALWLSPAGKERRLRNVHGLSMLLRDYESNISVCVSTAYRRHPKLWKTEEFYAKMSPEEE